MTNKKKTKIRKDDQVLVIAGNDRGKTGKVIRVNDQRVVVQGINVRKKHVKPTRTAKGGIIEREASIDVSNVKVCNENGRPVKLSVKVDINGKRELYYKDGGKEVVYRSLSAK